jgi:alpha-mannosidase
VQQHMIQRNTVEGDGYTIRSHQSYSYSFLGIEPKNVILSTLKPDEQNSNSDDQSLIVRIYEAEGKDVDDVRLTFYKQIRSASITDLLENEIHEIPILEADDRNRKARNHSRVYVNSNTIKTSIGPFKILTLRVKF